MLVGDVRSIMLELKTDKKWKDTIIGVASQQPVPMWAEECLEKVLDAYHICSILLPCVHKLRLFFTVSYWRRLSSERCAALKHPYRQCDE